MRLTEETFAAYAGPLADRGIDDPLANAYASARYARARYGDRRRLWQRLRAHFSRRHLYVTRAEAQKIAEGVYRHHLASRELVNTLQRQVLNTERNNLTNGFL